MAIEIPRIFHQIWVGPAPFPEEFACYQQTWLEHHPGWELRFWTDDNLFEGMRRPEAYERLRPPWIRGDILRLEVVWRFGGVHIDTDFECLRSIEPLLDGVDFFTAWMEDDRVNHAIMGAVPEHAIVGRALEEIQPSDHFIPWDKETTGPLFFNRVVATFPDATIFPKEYFFGKSAESREAAYAIHHEASAWKDTDVWKAELAKAKRSLEKAQLKAESWRARAKAAEAELAARRNGSQLGRLARKLGLRRSG
ncbi:MAG TPA: glycosyltransferase [Gaiellaceae bacterium]|nr:glycosyltransferase [Gaiellaceae bacterium]